MMKLIDLLQTGMFEDDESFEIYDKNNKHLFTMDAKRMLNFMKVKILNTEIIKISSARDYDSSFIKVILNDLKCNLQRD